LCASGASTSAQTRGAVTQFTVDGITVLIHRASNELVSAIVGFEGGFAHGDATNPALADFTADLVTSSGSATITKEDLRSFASRTSTSIAGDADLTGMRFSLTSTRSNFDRAWDILAGLITSPLYDETEFKNGMQSRVNRIRRRWSNPDDHAEIVADSILLLHEPILSRVVREEDVQGVTIDAMKGLMARLRERSRMVVVVVGNVTEQEIRKKVALFGSLPAGSFQRTELQAIRPHEKPHVVVVDRKSPTTYVYGRFSGPRMTSEDYWPLQVGLSHLRNVLFEEIRTKRNLSYAPGAWLGGLYGSTYGNISVSSTRPDSAIKVMFDELRTMRSREVDATRLAGSRSVYTTVYYLRQMTNGGVAQSIYTAWRNTGNWRAAFAIDEITRVQPSDVLRAFAKYARNLQVGVAGPAAGVTPQRYLFVE